MPKPRGAPDSPSAPSTCPLGQAGGREAGQGRQHVVGSPCHPLAGFQQRRTRHVGCCPGAKRPLRACASVRATAAPRLRAGDILLPNSTKFTARLSHRVCAGPPPLANELSSQMAKNPKLLAKPFFFQLGLVQPALGAVPLPARRCRDSSPSRSGLLSKEEKLLLCRAPTPLPLPSLWG